MFKISIYQMTLAAAMTGLAILLGVFGTFYVGGGGVYLIGIILFLMPLVLKLPTLVISTIISVVLSDFMTGWIAYTWISCIAYVSAVLIIWALNFLVKLKIIYIISTFVAAVVVVIIFYFLSFTIPGYDHARIVKDLIATIIEVIIAFIISNVLYLPFKLIPKGFK